LPRLALSSHVFLSYSKHGRSGDGVLLRDPSVVWLLEIHSRLRYLSLSMGISDVLGIFDELLRSLRLRNLRGLDVSTARNLEISFYVLTDLFSMHQSLFSGESSPSLPIWSLVMSFSLAVVSRCKKFPTPHAFLNRKVSLTSFFVGSSDSLHMQSERDTLILSRLSFWIVLTYPPKLLKSTLLSLNI
jgi:hypothetical protein